MDQIRGHLLLFLAVLVGSAIPFVPTGEMVSGSSALAANSRMDVVLIFLITWLASVIGDTLLLLEARMGARKLRPWLERRKYVDRVHEAEKKLHGNALSAIVTGRMVPGGRAPVIIALGMGRFPLRRFLAFDVVASGLWAMVYSTLGSIGGRIANHPLWGMVIAIAFAVCIGVLVQQLIRLVGWLRDRRTGQRTEHHHELDAPADLLDELTYLKDRGLAVSTPDDGAEHDSVPMSPSRPEMRTTPARKRAQQHQD